MRKETNRPGDISLLPRALQEEREQPLSQRERLLLQRAYALFDFFRDKLREDHLNMQRARRMRQLMQEERSTTAPPSNTLGSCIDNVVADQIDNMPEAQMIPEREETAQSAEEMSDVVSYVLYQAGWPNVYHTLMEDAAVTGTGIAQVFWDEDMEGGEGMANVLAWHPEDFYPDPMYENIQDGRGCFKVTHTTVAWVEEHYPQARGYVRADRYAMEDMQALREAPDGDEKTTLIEFWYKRYDAKKRKNRVHMAQLAGGALLYSTELDFGVARKGEFAQGVYAHGQYPFIFFRHRDVFQKPFGTGLIHDYRETQNAIDRYIKYIDDNARQSSVQRIFLRKNSGVNPDEVADMRNTIIEWEGSDIREVMQTVQAVPLNGQIYQIMNYLVDTMKQDCGQNQFTRGEGGLGVTAASAIQALQEAGGKVTRMRTERYKFAFKELVEQILWVLSEYMEPGRKMRIVGGWDSSGNMQNRLIELIAPGREGDALPKPAYTVRVQVQRNNPLQIQADNQFLSNVAQICAQSGQPLPPEAIIRLMEGYRTKASVLKTVEQNSRQLALIEQLRQTVAQLQAQLSGEQQISRGLKEALTTAGGGAALSARGAGVDYGVLLREAGGQ